MFRLLNKIFIILLFFLFFSCNNIEQFSDFINLKPIKYEINLNNNSILSDIFSPVIIKFDTKMNKETTEGIIQISSDLGIVKSDLSWKNNSLYFVPVSGWIPGIRYNLNLTGLISSADGREMRVERYLSFYAINRNNLPLLQQFSPINGISVGTNDLELKFYFSHPMEKQTVESALALDGIPGKKYIWSDDDKILTVIPEKPLSPWNLYKWTLRDTAKSIEGIPIPKTYSGFFITDLDKTLPKVESVYPVLFSDGSWFPTGADIESGLGSGHGIAVRFNKPMSENVLRSIRFDPSLSGRAEFLTDNSIVYIFSKDPEPENNYTLIVSGDARDNEGLRIGVDYRIIISPDIPYLNIISMNVNDSSLIDNSIIKNNVIQVNISPATGEVYVSIYFSLPFTIEEKQNAPHKISITPFFPRTISPVAINAVNWISDDRLTIQWEGLTASAADEEENIIPHFYKLNIPGGKSGINLENGAFIKRDITIYLEAIR